MISCKRQEKRTCYFRVTALLLLVIFVLTQFIYFSLWLPLIKSSIREERRRFDLELEQRLARERLREEQWQLEEEGRQRLGLYWDAPAAEEHCMTYNTRNYRAQLLGAIPYEYNWLEACKRIPVIIHGKSIEPNECRRGENVSYLIVFKGWTLMSTSRDWECMGIGM